MLHIVPTVPPEANGLADYCYQLWKNWPQPRPHWKCLVTYVPAQAPDVWPECDAEQFSTHRAGLITALEAHQPQTVVLHYVGYAYQPKGVPWWLPAALRHWKHHHKENARLIIMFHELYAEGGSWKQSSFWLRPLAKRIMIDLAQLADHWITSNPIYAQKIEAEAQTRSTKGTVIPVGTNIPAVSNPQTKIWPLGEGRRLKIVVFGLPNTRLWALQAHENLIQYLCSQNLVEQITLLGKPVTHPQTQASLGELRGRIGFEELWREQFNPSDAEISQAVSEHDLGLLSNHPGILSKSGVYAMFCEHRIVSVVVDKQGDPDVSKTYPHFANDDAQPQLCALRLQDRVAVATLQQSVENAARNVLSWSSITASWQEIVAQVETRPSSTT